jgi:hypothetical protein
MAAANIAMTGMDPMRFLETDSDLERRIMMAVSAAVLDQQEKRDHNLAVQIVNGVGKMFGG